MSSIKSSQYSYNIWCYWDQGSENIPEFHNLCMESWKKHLDRKWKINIVDRKYFNILCKKYDNSITPEFLAEFTIQQLSDLARLFVLKHFGGVWIDITTVLLKNFTWLTDKWLEGYDYVGFYLNTKKYIENWFIAVPYPHTYIITKWYDIFLKILREATHKYGIVQSKTWQNTQKDHIDMIAPSEYLSMHVAISNCMQTDSKFLELIETKGYLVDAKATAFIFQDKCKWYTGAGCLLKGLGSNVTPGSLKNTPLIKLRGGDVGFAGYYGNSRFREVFYKNTGKKYGRHKNIVQLFIVFLIFSPIFLCIYLQHKTPARLAAFLIILLNLIIIGIFLGIQINKDKIYWKSIITKLMTVNKQKNTRRS